MKLQYNNLEELDLGAVETAITNAVEKPITFLDNFDATNIQETSASNTRLVGYDWNNGGQVIVRGNHFLDDSPLVTITSIEFSNSTTASLKITGNVSFNYNNGLYSGYYSSFSYQSNTGNLTVEYTGRLNVDRNTADVTGGTTTLIKVINDDFSYSLKGSMSVNANMDITGGTVTDFSLSDANGNALSFSGMSLNALTFEQLSDFQANSDLSNLLNYISSNLTGDFSIEAGSGDQTLTGNVGNNILDGGAGADTLIGGKGNDTYIVDNENDVVEEALNAGIDLVKASSNFTLSDNVENLTLTDGSANGGTNPLEGTGNALANTITGNAGNNILDGGAGVDKLIGGNGNDTYIVDMVRTGTTLANYKVALQDTITEAANAGTDTVQLRLQDGAVQMNNATTLTLAANLENLDASLTEDTKLNLTGNALANTLTGNDADNILDGGAGVDTLRGGKGDDTYILDLKVSGTGASANVNTFDDSITETNGNSNGSDTIKLRGAATLATATTLTLDGDWIDIENLDASATGKTKLNLTGNSLNNILTGNAAANILTGGDGNDTYVVNNIDDSVVEAENEGTDIIQASITYSLVLADNVENLELTGTASINGTGNDDANIITGNAGNNILDGKGGIDSLRGGKGNDTYIVDNENDVVEEALNAGIDLVKASSNFTLSDNVENLTLTDGSANGGTNPLEGTGNALANTITGNAGNNILDGGAGVDKLIGGNGNDTYIVDMVRTGTTLANYKVALQDTITEAANAGTDTVQLRLQDGAVQMNNATTLTLAANLENLDASLTEDTKLNLTGNALANTLTGNYADNILDGGAGVDSLIGGLGDDTYILDLKVSGTGASANVSTFDDSIEETNGSNNGSDTIKLRGAATLTSATELTLDGDWIDIENLDASATGKTKLNLTGNSLNNILTGNAAANVLKGLGGDDTYVVNNIDDTVVEQNNEGTDLVQASITYTLGLNVENLELLGTTAINGNGNSLANTITGNAGNNILDGKGGNDILIGAKGNDTYVIDNSGVTVTEQTNEGIDQVNASVNYTLVTNVENLLLTGSGDIIGTGNELANTITGNAGNNILDGGAGVDKLIGGNGNDTYIVDLVRTGTTLANYKVALQDTITEAANAGTDTVQLRLQDGAVQMNNATTLTLAANLESLDASLTEDTKLNLTGNALANTLTGNDADNILDGGAGNDILTGGKGNDTLKGGLGADVLKWGADDLGSAGDISNSTDTIIDFSVTQGDQLDLRDLLDGESSANILDYISIEATGTSTVLRISSTGQFDNGYDSVQEDARIILSNTNLLTATGQSTYELAIQHMITNQSLLID
jgi:serralysin